MQMMDGDGDDGRAGDGNDGWDGLAMLALAIMMSDAAVATDWRAIAGRCGCRRVTDGMDRRVGDDG